MKIERKEEPGSKTKIAHACFAFSRVFTSGLLQSFILFCAKCYVPAWHILCFARIYSERVENKRAGESRKKRWKRRRRSKKQMNLNINIEFIDIQHFIRVCVCEFLPFTKKTHTRKFRSKKVFLKLTVN